MTAKTYINTTCKVGQGQECGRDAVWVIAVTAVADNSWTDESREGGVVGLCEFHANTPVTEWDATSAKDAADRSQRIREAFERSSFGTPAAKAARESVSDERAARVVKRAEELAAERVAHPTPQGPPGAPRHTHDDGTICQWVTRAGIDRWRVVDQTRDAGPCPGFGPSEDAR